MITHGAPKCLGASYDLGIKYIMLRLHETCGWSPLVDLGRHRDLWPVERPYVITLMQMSVVVIYAIYWLYLLCGRRIM